LQGFARHEPIVLYFQLQAEFAYPQGLVIEVVIATPRTATQLRKVALTVGFRRAVEPGLTELQQEVDVSRLAKGTYEVEINVRHPSSNAQDRRRATLVLQ
jgi:YbbR domain-containing protein